ncbi:uncharacterized protein LOC109793927 isoform X4 [Cajanus cajan]|uniref:uncharacterized protein LOC109793927 isoform X4 n=1 Tax=Cajanus cajan TaxID=3821 RepID=UPI00098DBB45|nr:uncharacterized protein LOC109793927 isoform X4 [Cajanus cajan]
MISFPSSLETQSICSKLRPSLTVMTTKPNDCKRFSEGEVMIRRVREELEGEGQLKGCRISVTVFIIIYGMATMEIVLELEATSTTSELRSEEIAISNSGSWQLSCHYIMLREGEFVLIWIT